MSERAQKQDKGSGGKAAGGKSDTSKGDSVECKHCGETGHKTLRCPDRFCGVCGRKWYSVEICSTIVTVLACEKSKSHKDDNDTVISSEETEAFMFDTRGELRSNESINNGGCRALAWQVGDLTVICDSGASCHISHS